MLNNSGAESSGVHGILGSTSSKAAIVYQASSYPACPSPVDTSIALNEVVSLTLLELHSYLRYNSMHGAGGNILNMYPIV